ncbi:uncharacterized protein LOC100679191 [Nasonia vitripennis]|uniref:Uncharacterized protein n=1 Tax=Nasonia vitripennis TaxID=7425 RepID=A0A7M7HE15_NASVI|nr:uncharacterized protein LOC100679191 [Nasonia vitripennis]
MDDYRLYKYYRSTGFGWKSLVYNYLLTDRYFRTLFHFGPRCGAITAITSFLVLLVLTYTITSWTIFLLNTKKFNELRHEAEKKLPRKESVLQVRPAYNCINKHLQQADVFLDKTKKVVRKEQLEVEIMNSRINSISELLNPGDQSPWQRSQSPKGYFRDINTPLKK